MCSVKILLRKKGSSLQVYWSRANYDSSTHYWQEKVNCHSLTLIFTFFSVSWNTYHAWCQSFPTFFLFYQVFLKHNQWWIRYSTSSRTNFDWLHQEMNRIYEWSLWDCHFQNAQTPWWERLICTFINWQVKKVNVVKGGQTWKSKIKLNYKPWSDRADVVNAALKTTVHTVCPFSRLRLAELCSQCVIIPVRLLWAVSWPRVSYCN